MTDQKTAVDYLMAGHSCSQALVMAYCQRFGLNRDTAAKLATGLAGGLAQGKTCGAVTGAIIVTGLKFGSGAAWDRYTNEQCAMAAQEFCHQFRKRQKTIQCRQILERHRININDPQQIKGLRESGLCARIVEDAQEILEKLLKETF
ncbi:MAG: C-GCAxxG-C-C family protein [Desulfobacterales bacterium]|nr:C-GCAxxG-C-C family protein [Desulfobacterales bacterium]